MSNVCLTFSLIESYSFIPENSVSLDSSSGLKQELPITFWDHFQCMDSEPRKFIWTIHINHYVTIHFNFMTHIYERQCLGPYILFIIINPQRGQLRSVMCQRINKWMKLLPFTTENEGLHEVSAEIVIVQFEERVSRRHPSKHRTSWYRYQKR